MAIGPFDTSGVERGADGIKRYTDRPASLVEMLRSSVQRTPESEVVVEIGGERLSYQQLWERAACVAGGLKAQGLKRGDRAAIRLGNGVDWVLAFWGCQLAGLVVVPVNTRFTDKEADYVINDSGASYVFKPGESLPDGEPEDADDLEPEDLAGIFYTSGTTGFPKGAMTTHRNFLSNCETCLRVLDLPRDGRGVRNLVSVPLFHVTGCNSQLLPTLEMGGTTVIMPEFNVKDFLKAIKDEQINLLTSVPAVYWLAISQPEFEDLDVSGIRWLTYGGAPISPDLVKRLKNKFPNAMVGNGFGLTETSSVATFLPHKYAEEYADSVGFASPVVDLDLLEPDPGTGVGELMVRGSCVVAGYWNKPEATRSAFVDGWLYTGDMARIDEAGRVYIVDRKKNMINRGGENVYCVEVENVLAAHPAIYEAAAVGVPDEMMGEKVGAVVIPVPGENIDPGEVVEFCRQHLADFKVPQYMIVRGEPLPRNPGGKMMKPRLRENLDWGKALF